MIQQPIFFGGNGCAPKCSTSAIDSSTIAYTGGNLTIIGAVTNDRLDVILAKINTTLDGIGGGGVGTVISVNSVLPVSGNVTITKSTIGLGNADDTSDVNKPISTATQLALNNKQNFLGTPSNGQIPIGNGTAFALSTLIAGTNISITNGVGTITIEAIGGSGGGVSINDSAAETTTTWSGSNTSTKLITKTTYLDDITALTSFVRVSVTSVHVRDLRRGGHFQYQASGYTVDNGVVFAATGGGYWVRQFNSHNGVNIDWWGAIPNDSTDTRPFAVSAIAYLVAYGGGMLTFSAGTYSSTVPSGGALPHSLINLYGKTNITIKGVKGKTILKLASGEYVGDTYFIATNASSSFITIRDLILDGNRGGLINPNEQTHGVQLLQSKDIDIEGCVFQHWFGDGMRLLGTNAGSYGERYRINNCKFLDNHRSGITMQRANKFVTITNNFFSETNDQDIDFEPTGDGGPTDIIISDNIFDHTSRAGNIAITLSGIGVNNASTHNIFSNNILIEGTIQAVNIEDITVEGNLIYNTIGGSDIALLFLGYVYNVRIINNSFYVSGTKGIKVFAQNGVYPEKIKISGNTIKSGGEGIFIESFTKDLIISDNVISRYSATIGTLPAIHVKNVLAELPGKNVRITNNFITDTLDGIWVVATEPLENVIITGNSIDSAIGGVGITLSGGGANWNGTTVISDNIITPTIKVLNTTGPSWYFTKGNETEFNSIITSRVAPEGTIAAEFNSVCYNTVTAIAYRKTTAAGTNTGWFQISTYNHATASQAYVGTLTFDGGDPSGTTNHTYSWNRVNNVTFYRIHLSFSTASATDNTFMIATLPSDMPNPLRPTGFTTASNILYPAMGAAATGLTTTTDMNTKFRRNAANTAYEWVMSLGAVGYKTFWIEGFYFTS